MSCLNRVWVVALLVALATALPARAEEAPSAVTVSAPSESEPAAPTRTALRRDPPELLRLGGSYTTPASLDEGGRAAVARAALSTGYAARFDSGLFLLGTVGVERSWYRFEDTDGLSREKDPVRPATQVDLFCLATIPLSDRWRMSVGPLASFSAEEGARLGAAINGGGTISLGWRIIPDLELSFGAIGITRFEEDPLVIPVVGFDWRASDFCRLRTRGTNLEASYEDDRWRFAATVGWKFRQYRLDEVDPAPSGVLEDQRITAAVEGEWRLRPWIGLGARVGVVGWQRYVLRDSRGDHLQAERSDPALEVGIFLVLRLPS